MWVLDPSQAEAIISELSNQTDRGAAIIATALIDDALRDAIAGSMKRDKTVEDRLFSGTGGLASLSARIDLAYLLGIIAMESRKLLTTIRGIRNEFAHFANPRSFDSQRIKDLSMTLYKPQEVFMLLKNIAEPHVGKDGETLYTQMLEAALAELPAEDTPRSRFLTTARLCLLEIRLSGENQRSDRSQIASLEIHAGKSIRPKKTESRALKAPRRPPKPSLQ